MSQNNAQNLISTLTSISTSKSNQQTKPNSSKLYIKNYFQQGTYKKEFRDYFYQVGFLTIATKTILAPLQRWKIIKQTQHTYPLRPKKFQNLKDYIRRIPKEQGYLALWRGNGAGIALYFWQIVFQIGIYDNMKNYMRKMIQQQQEGSLFSKFLQKIIYPIFATVATQLITYPIDVARIRLTMNYQKQKKKSYFTGIRTALKHIKTQQEGFKPIYRGFLFSNVLSFLHLNAFLSISAIFKYLTIPASDQVKKLQSSKYINLQIMTSVASLLLIYPLDTLKKIIQLNNNSKPILFENIRDVLKHIQRQSTIFSLFNGLQVSIFKTLLFLPVFSACSFMFSQAKQSFSSQTL